MQPWPTGKGILDAYLKPFISSPVGYEKPAEGIAQAPGFDGSDVAANDVLGEMDEPSVKAQYEAVVAKRKRAKGDWAVLLCPRFLPPLAIAC